MHLLAIPRSTLIYLKDTTIIPFQHSFPMPRSNVGVVSVDRSTPF